MTVGELGRAKCVLFLRSSTLEDLLELFRVNTFRIRQIKLQLNSTIIEQKFGIVVTFLSFFLFFLFLFLICAVRMRLCLYNYVTIGLDRNRSSMKL